MDLTVVAPLYRSEEFVEPFYRRIVDSAEKCVASFEIVFVDDGSPDQAGEKVRGLMREDERVRLVELSRNFGHHPAMLAGLSEAQGDLVFLIDVDLEEEPEWLSEFISDLRENDVDVVVGVQQKRVGPWIHRITGTAFSKLFNLLSETQIPEDQCTVRLMSRPYVDAMTSLPESNLFMGGHFAWVGFRQLYKSVQKSTRSSPSSYSFIKRLSLFSNAITSFTSYPLKVIFYLGLSVTTFAAVFGIILIIWKLKSPEAFLLGWPSVMVSIWFIGGLLILFLGLIGIYVSKLYTEAKSRPPFIVRKVYGAKRN